MKFFWLKKEPQGLSLILPVLLLGVAGIAVFLFLASSVSVSLAEILPKQDALKSREYLLGCLDEYLVHLNVDQSFSPTSMNFFDTACTSVVSDPVSGQKQIVLTMTKRSVTRQLTALVQLSPLSIIRISEP